MGGVQPSSDVGEGTVDDSGMEERSMSELQFRQGTLASIASKGFDHADHNCIFVEGMPGQGKTGLVMAIAEFFADVYNDEAACGVIAVRGAVAQLSGGRTCAYYLDTAVMDGQARCGVFLVVALGALLLLTMRAPLRRNEDGTARMDTFPDARRRICGLRTLIVDESEENSGTRLNVRHFVVHPLEPYAWCLVVCVYDFQRSYLL